MIKFKVTRKQSFTLSLENTFLEKPEKGSNGQYEPHLLLPLPPLVILGLRVAYYSAAKRIIIKLAFSRSFFGTFLSIQVFFFHRDQEPRHDNHKNFSRAGFFVDSC